MVDTIYDCETFPNFFCCVVKHVGTDTFGAYEISARRDDSAALVAFVRTLDRMVGFNCVHFDYVLIHWLDQAVSSGEAHQLSGERLARRLYELVRQIIDAQSGERYAFNVRECDRLVPQIDLFLIHHLNNRARMTGLKALEIVMRSPRVQDLPFPVGSILEPWQMDITIDYCCNDVAETERFYHLSATEIAFREQLGPSYLSANDGAIGKRRLVTALEKRDPGCTKRQTIRRNVPLKDVILPYVQFRYQPFRELLAQLREVNVPALEVKQAFKPAPVFHRGFTYGFGLGGLHGSVKRRYVRADDEHEILDIDVTSYYPRLAIVNGMRPAHLGEVFNTVYSEIFDDRQRYPKGSSENLALKLALNKVFGDSGSAYSPFYDIAFMLGITVNGQLLLCMLAEVLTEIVDLEIIQANTDGLTLRFPRHDRARVDEIIAWWQWGTGLKLEAASYRRMWVRDVNNYLAEYDTGKVKRVGVGTYEYNIDWWQDPSMLCVPRAVEAHLIRSEPILDYLRQRAIDDPWDFLIRGRVRGKDKFEHGGRPVQKITRYYVSTTGTPLVKIAPALAGKSNERRTQLQGGRPVVLCDEFDGRPRSDIDMAWYAAEVEKLVKFN